jgi:hypothetical protein
MKQIRLALCILIATPAFADQQSEARARLLTWLDSYEECIRIQTIRVGYPNPSIDPVSATRAARARCAEPWSNVLDAYFGDQPKYEYKLNDFRSNVDNAAINDLIGVRQRDRARRR